MYLKGRPITMFMPKEQVDSYCLEARGDLPSNKLKLDWVYPSNKAVFLSFPFFLKVIFWVRLGCDEVKRRNVSSALPTSLSQSLHVLILAEPCCHRQTPAHRSLHSAASNNLQAAGRLTHNQSAASLVQYFFFYFVSFSLVFLFFLIWCRKNKVCCSV